MILRASKTFPLLTCVLLFALGFGLGACAEESDEPAPGLACDEPGAEDHHGRTEE